MQNNYTIERELKKLTVRFTQPCCVESITFDRSDTNRFKNSFRVQCPTEEMKKETVRVLKSEHGELAENLPEPSRESFLYPAVSVESAWELFGTLAKKGRISMNPEAIVEILAHVENMGLDYGLSPRDRGNGVQIPAADWNDALWSGSTNILASHVPVEMYTTARIAAEGLAETYRRPTSLLRADRAYE